MVCAEASERPRTSLNEKGMYIHVPDPQSCQRSSHTAINSTGGCHGMGTLGNVPLASAYGRCTAAALSCIQWKAHHKFHVPHDIEYLQLQLQQKNNPHERASWG